MPNEGRRRAVIRGVAPSIDDGRFPAKRIIGDLLLVEAGIFADGHESIAAVLRFRHEDLANWTEVPMEAGSDDRWRACFQVEKLGRYFYTVQAWTDPLKTFAATLPKPLEVIVEPTLAKVGAWYQLFPRSCSLEPGRHGTFRDVAARLERIAEMGFEVVHFPPIHPIGSSRRKGRHGHSLAADSDPGSPWAIGSAAGGHKSVHPELGTLAEFRQLLALARRLGLEIALDLAFQCSPNHPYLQEHPEWFRRLPDGSIQCAENPPHRYEDVYPFDFETNDWPELWAELKSVVEFWIEQGVRVFRVDNPHTKPFAFWEWLINDLKQARPELIFLGEALTRPSVQYHLSKLGFSQSYTYFPWRNTKREIIEYFTELNQPEPREYFRPALWVNTPQNLSGFLQQGGPAAFKIRLILAATLGATYGIYGPAFEFCETRALPGSEEYADSEQFELKHWDWEAQSPLHGLLTLVNRLRREHKALQAFDSLHFHSVSNDQLIAYSNHDQPSGNAVLTVVNLDPHHTQSGWIDVSLEAVGLPDGQAFEVRDLLTNRIYSWRGRRNYVELDPFQCPAHLLAISATNH